MTLGTHAIIGAAAASFFPSHPVIAFCAGFASHFLADAIPHGDYRIRSASIDPQIAAPIKFEHAFFLDALTMSVDSLAGILVALFFFATPQQALVVFIGACAGILPDPLQFVYSRFPREPLVSLQRFHEWIHTKHRLHNRPVLAVFSQAVIVVLVIALTRSFL